jgi:hypothetical protein
MRSKEHASVLTGDHIRWKGLVCQLQFRRTMCIPCETATDGCAWQNQPCSRASKGHSAFRVGGESACLGMRASLLNGYLVSRHNNDTVTTKCSKHSAVVSTTSILSLYASVRELALSAQASMLARSSLLTHGTDLRALAGRGTACRQASNQSCFARPQ